MAFLSGGRFRELLKKYGKVALGVHFSVSAVSITGLYVAIRNNVDVESLLEKMHIGGVSSKDQAAPADEQLMFEETGNRPSEVVVERENKQRNRTAELAASSGGALALAVLCNKALFPIRAPITVGLTPPVARFLARRKIVKSGLKG